MSRSRSVSRNVSQSLCQLVPPVPPPPPAPPARTFKCPVCLDESEGNGVVASTAGAVLCGHETCSPCFASYAEHSVVHNRRAAVACVARGCAAGYTLEVVAAALAGRLAALVILYDLAAHGAAGRLIYCPHCGEPLSLPDEALVGPSECLRCHRALCGSCVRACSPAGSHLCCPAPPDACPCGHHLVSGFKVAPRSFVRGVQGPAGGAAPAGV